MTYLLIVVLLELDLVLLSSPLVQEPKTDECPEDHCRSAEFLGTRADSQSTIPTAMRA
jgi:hypothetical protein